MGGLILEVLRYTDTHYIDMGKKLAMLITNERYTAMS